MDLAAKIYKKHLADGTNSELKNLVDADWSKTGPTIAGALAFHAKAEELKAQMEERYRLRDAAYAPIKNAVDVSAKYLKGKYSTNPKKLGDWGYAIDDTPAKPRKKKES